MLNPVSRNEFFETTAGEEFLERYDSEESTVFTTRDPHSNEKIPMTEEKKEETKARIAEWITGNFDPETGMHTLYRVVNRELGDRYQAEGKMSSRAMDLFGHEPEHPSLAKRLIRSLTEKQEGGLYDNAISNIESTLRGDTPKRIGAKILELTSKDKEHIAFRPYYEPASQEARDVADGKLSQNAKSNLETLKENLQAANSGGTEAYLEANKRFSMDDTPSRITDINELTHPSIHLTSDTKFALNILEKGWGTEIFEVQFKPEAIAAAPGTGVVDGELVNQGELFYGEFEWYALGNIVHNGEDVIIKKVTEKYLHQKNAERRLEPNQVALVA